MTPNKPTGSILTTQALSDLDSLSFTREHQIRNRTAPGSCIFLSPHYDDVCFSLGDFLASACSLSELSAPANNGILLNFFTRTNYLAIDRKHRLSSCAPGSEVETISDIRRTEDRLFAAKVHVSSRDCGLDDAPLRGRDPFGGYDLTHDIAILERPIMSAISACRKDATGTGAIFCPMGIGGHIDHTLVQDIILTHYDDLKRTANIYFYEDLYYASSYKARVEALSPFLQRIHPRRAVRLLHSITDIRIKLDLIRIYESQLATLPLDLEEFSPNVGAPSPAHEAVWVLTDE